MPPESTSKSTRRSARLGKRPYATPAEQTKPSRKAKRASTVTDAAPTKKARLEESQPTPSNAISPVTDSSSSERVNSHPLPWCLNTVKADEYTAEMQPIWAMFAIVAQFPNAIIEMNPTKPRSKSFEITVLTEADSSDGQLIWSGIKKGPPRKEKFPDEAHVVSLVANVINAASKQSK
ncbi:hypothetical protein BDF19DRAFT_478949 [Syncephalis fuscata]|nr:hypothetical protein BDF19DRAFT_478949 [Syncephalis fuscata]